MTAAGVIRLERRMRATPESVFRYLTEPALWTRWQGRAVVLEPVPGGVFRVTMDEGQVVEGRFLEVEPNARVVVTWGWHGHPRMPPGTTTVEFDLVPDSGGTLLRLTHHGLPPDDLPMHQAGWDLYAERLATVVDGGDPGTDPNAS